MGEYAHSTSHVKDTQKLLLSQFAGSQRLQGLLGTVGARAQTLDDVDDQLYNERDVTNSVGAQLTVLGAIVGEPRRSRADTLYRAWVKGRIAANNSESCGADIYRVARLIVGSELGHTMLLTTVPPAAYELEIRGAALAYSWDDSVLPDTVAFELANILLEATGSGIELQLVYQSTDDAHTFTFASGDVEEDDANAGLADDDDDLDADGGLFSGVEQRT
jgi:hypothetical protein